MVAYICDRCGYSTDLKGNIRRHFLKKKTCRVILKDVSIEQCFEEQLGEKMNSTLKNAENGPIHSKKTLKNAENLTKTKCENKTDNNLTCIYCNTTFQHKRYLDDHLRRSCRIIKSRIEQHVQPYINIIEEMKDSINHERLMRQKDQEIIEILKKKIYIR